MKIITDKKTVGTVPHRFWWTLGI